MKLGFVGLGNMGRPMARRLVHAGHELVVFDTDRRAVDEMVNSGAIAATSLRALAQQADIVCVSLPTPNVVEEVLTGPESLAAGRPSIVIDLSTTGPEVARRVSEKLNGLGVTLIDAPVSGGTPGAEAGTLSIMVSGPLVAFEQVKDVLDQIGTNIFYLGSEPGQGQMMKLVNNMLCAAATSTAFEALVLGAKAGLDARKMLDVINMSSGRSFATEVKIAQCVIDRSFPMRFATNLLAKDVRLCIEEATRLGVPMSINGRVHEFLTDCLNEGYGDRDYGTIIQLLEGQAGAIFAEKDTKTYD